MKNIKLVICVSVNKTLKDYFIVGKIYQCDVNWRHPDDEGEDWSDCKAVWICNGEQESSGWVYTGSAKFILLPDVN
jgi:hypothetical protein